MAKRRKGYRKRQKARQNKQKQNVGRYYPTMYCVAEELYIGVSNKPMKFKGDRFGRIKPKYKVNDKHWLPECCSFRSGEYIIDMRNKQDGDMIVCSKCGSAIDFRLFYSNTIPRMVDVDDQKDNTEESTEA